MGCSIADRLNAVKFRPSGFDYMRILLAIFIVFFHSFLFAYGTRFNSLIWHSWARGFVKFLIPMFFCLSGFLVAGSLERCKTLVTFLGLRAIRIYPALIVEIALSAIVIGPLATTLPLTQYFMGHQFLRYLANVTGDISYYLPGVFTRNPFPEVINTQLWTVPFELLCYITLSLLTILGLKKHRLLLPVCLAILLAYIFMSKAVFSHQLATDEVEEGPFLVAFFLAGVGAYLYREILPYNHRLTAIAGLSSFLLLSYVPGGDFLGVFTLAYFTVGIGLTDFKRIAFIGFADFSYGIYLYHGVIGQFIVDKLPWSHHWYWTLILTLPATSLFALGSWYLVEKPALSLKSHISDLERKLESMIAFGKILEPPKKGSDLAQSESNL